MNKLLILDMRSCFLSGEERHPQTVIKALGITYQKAVPQTISDTWEFWNPGNLPEPLPPYLKITEYDPMQYIGYGLSKEDAEQIRDFETDK